MSALLLLTLAGVFVTRTAFARFRQADADLGLARTARDTGNYEWSLSPASKPPTKQSKRYFSICTREAWGHVLIALMDALPPQSKPDAELMDRARVLELQIFFPVAFQFRRTFSPSPERRWRSWIHRHCWTRSEEVAGAIAEVRAYLV